MNNRNGRASRGLPGSIPSWLSKGRYCVSRVSHFESIETSIWRRKSEGGEAIVRIGSSTGVSPNLLPTLRASGQAQPRCRHHGGHLHLGRSRRAASGGHA